MDQRAEGGPRYDTVIPDRICLIKVDRRRVGEQPLVGAAGFSGGLVLGALAAQVVLGGLVAARLGDVHGMQHRVDAAVAAQIEPVPLGLTVTLPGGNRHRGCAAPAGKARLGGEPGRVADLHQQLHRADGGDADLLGQGAAMPRQHRGMRWSSWRMRWSSRPMSAAEAASQARWTRSAPVSSSWSAAPWVSARSRGRTWLVSGRTARTTRGSPTSTGSASLSSRRRW